MMNMLNHFRLNVAMLFFLLYFTGVSSLSAQTERKEIRQGNNLYEKGSYSDAETEYRKALEKNKNSFPGNYNLGGALYRQKKYEEAIREYKESSAKTTGKNEQANAFHNLGNSLIQSQQYGEAVDAYKKALKLNPDDEDTRYNLAYAQTMLRNQQQQQQQQGNNQNQNKDQKDQNKQQQDQNKDQQKEDQQQADNNNQKEEQQQQKKNQQQPKMSKEDAERLLKALQNDEKDLQEKLTRKEGQKVRVEKEW
jgi:Ca-activated chloride channel family protein